MLPLLALPFRMASTAPGPACLWPPLVVLSRERISFLTPPSLASLLFLPPASLTAWPGDLVAACRSLLVSWRGTCKCRQKAGAGESKEARAGHEAGRNWWHLFQEVW